MPALHGKKISSEVKPVKRTSQSPKGHTEVDLSHIFESLLPTASVMQHLAPYKSFIETLKKNKVPMKLVARKLIAEGKLDIELGPLTNALEEFGEKPMFAARSPKPIGVRRPPIPAAVIQPAVEKVMKRMHVRHFTVRDRDVIDGVVAEVPALASYPRHERNRKIMDAFIKRTTGNLVVRVNRKGQREIAFAA